MMIPRIRRQVAAAGLAAGIALVTSGCGTQVATGDAAAPQPATPSPSGAQCNMTWDNGGAMLAPYCDFSGQKLWEFDAYRGSLPYAKFVGSLIQCSAFQWASLSRANFSSAHLNGTSFDSADLQGANFTNADLTPYKGGYCEDPSNSALSSANLQGAIFTGAKLTGVDLTGSTCSAQTVWTNGKALPTPAGADPAGFDCPQS